MTIQAQTQKYRENFVSTIIPFSLLLLGVFFLSFAAILIRLSEQEIGANATIFNRLWIATIFFGLWNQITNFIPLLPSESTPSQENKIINHLGILLLLAIVDLMCLLFWAWSLNQTSITNSNLLHNLTPIFATFGGWLFLNQSFNSRFVVGVILASLGSSTIAFSDLQFGSQYFIGDVLALLSALFYGVSYLIYERLRNQFSATSLLFWTCFFRSILLLPLALITEPQLFPSSWSGWLTVICLGIFCQGLGNLIFIHTLKQFSAGFVSLFLLLEPILTAIFAWIIFVEKLNFINWIAFTTVLVGIYFAKSGLGAQKSTRDAIKSDGEY